MQNDNIHIDLDFKDNIADKILINCLINPLWKTFYLVPM